MPLEILSLIENMLNGSIPGGFFAGTPAAANLKQLFLKNNSFEGSLPAFPNMPQLQELRLENCSLSGETDVVLVKYQSLCTNTWTSQPRLQCKLCWLD